MAISFMCDIVNYFKLFKNSQKSQKIVRRRFVHTTWISNFLLV